MEIEFQGLRIGYPEASTVYPPAEDSFLAAKMVAKCLEESKSGSLNVLDMGTGTGILGLTALRSKKVSEVTFVDVNQDAIEAARRNCIANNLSGKRCEFITGDLFSGVKGRFDMIIFNAPYLPHEEALERFESRALDGGRDGIELTIRFLSQAKGHMNKESRIIIVASSLGNLNELEEEIERLGLKITEREKEHIFFEDIVVMAVASKPS